MMEILGSQGKLIEDEDSIIHKSLSRQENQEVLPAGKCALDFLLLFLIE